MFSLQNLFSFKHMTSLPPHSVSPTWLHTNLYFHTCPLSSLFGEGPTASFPCSSSTPSILGPIPSNLHINPSSSSNHDNSVVLVSSPINDMPTLLESPPLPKVSISPIASCSYFLSSSFSVLHISLSYANSCEIWYL